MAWLLTTRRRERDNRPANKVPQPVRLPRSSFGEIFDPARSLTHTASDPGPAPVPRNDPVVKEEPDADLSSSNGQSREPIARQEPAVKEEPDAMVVPKEDRATSTRRNRPSLSRSYPRSRTSRSWPSRTSRRSRPSCRPGNRCPGDRRLTPGKTTSSLATRGNSPGPPSPASARPFPYSPFPRPRAGPSAPLT